MSLWSKLAGIILRNKIAFILLILVTTVFFSLQWKYVKVSYSQNSILPKENPYVKDYEQFKKDFGGDSNMVLIGVKDSLLFTAEKLNAWNQLSKKIRQFPEIAQIISIDNLKILQKDTLHQRFVLADFCPKKIASDQDALLLKKKLFDSLPFYENIIYNKKTGVVQSIFSLKKNIVNTKDRVDFIVDKIKPLIELFSKEQHMDVHTSGLLYIKSLDAVTLKNEIPFFLGLTLLVTGFIILFFFRTGSPLILSFLIVGIDVMWTFGMMGLLRYQISILTAIIPPLVIIIGVPNAVFLINKYQQEIQKHGNQMRSLQRVISKTGNAILMTNLTTAIGFGTFVIVNNKLLKEFGLIAALSIFSIFILSILLIPIFYSYRKIPKEKHLKHLNKTWINKFIDKLIKTIRKDQKQIFGISILLIIISMIGIFKIKVSGSILSDLPRNTIFYQDIKFFEKEFGGILPLEFVIDTKRKKGAYKLSTLKRVEKLKENIEDIPELSKPISLVDLSKYAKQTFYGNNPKYYQLPSTHEKNFILPFVKNSDARGNLLKSYADSTGQYLRVTTFMKDVETKDMEKIERYLEMKNHKIFPKEKFNVTMTGKARLFLKGTHYLIDNLAWSLGLAILLIAIFIAWMFGWSWKMSLIALIPNLLPLLITAGVMGFFGIPLKPSTILIFSIAYGISVDDTIHYLAKLRQELQHHQWHIKRSVYKALKETGISMFYTSIILFAGFLSFIMSSYGGTKALGGLISFTLLVAMFSNLLLLPALVLFVDDYFKNKKTFKKPEIDIFPEDINEL